MKKDNLFETLGDYMRDVFDSDGDGIVSIKELFSVFPNMAIPIAIIFVDILVLAAEYRVWDFGYHVTGNEILAVGFVLVSAVPFLLGQVFWLYPRAVLVQKIIAIAFIGTSLVTSALFGLADLTKDYDLNAIYSMLVQLTVGYIVATLIYIVVDPTIKANRQKKIAADKAKFEREKLTIARSVLDSLRETLNAGKELENEFGASEVAQALAQVSGRKKQKQDNRQPKPVQSFASETDAPPKNPTPGGN